MKKIFLALILILIGGTAWYLISPLFKNVELNEPAPFTNTAVKEVAIDLSSGGNTNAKEQSIVNDAFDSMDDETRLNFEKAVDEMPKGKVMEEEEPTVGPLTLGKGSFHERAHEVAGTAAFIEHEGERVLRMEDFETVNGPNLHVYLASDLGDGDFIDLGELKATKGNVNYEIDPSVDLEKYNKVLIWCVPFRVLFSYAEVK